MCKSGATFPAQWGVPTRYLNPPKHLIPYEDSSIPGQWVLKQALRRLIVH